jgi:hypothetical protein
LFVDGIPSDRESGGLGGGLDPAVPAVPVVDGRASGPRVLLRPLMPVVAPELRRGARPLRLPLKRLAASPSAALDDH